MNPVTGAMLAASAAGAIGTWSSNASNRKEAARNRAFQERMSSTAAQRAVKDYEAAGLNPALAYERPASSPGGSVSAPQEDVLSKAVSSGVSAAIARKQLESMQVSNERTAAETAKVKVEGANAALQGDLLAQEKLLKAQELSFRTAIQPHQTRAAALANMMTQFGLSKAEAESLYFKFMGPAGVAIDNLAGPAAGLVGAGAGVAALLKSRGMVQSSGRAASTLFPRPKPRTPGTWEKYEPSPRRPRGFQSNQP